MLDTAPLETNFKMLGYFYGSGSFADTDHLCIQLQNNMKQFYYETVKPG